MDCNKKIGICIYLLCCLGFSGWAQPVRVPAEWEKQDQVHLSWFGSIRRDSVLCRVIEALQPAVAITLNIPADSLSHSIMKKLSQYQIDTGKINVVTDPYADFWTRDPLYFALDSNKLKVVCFNYSMYGVFSEIPGQEIPEDIQKIGAYDERTAGRLGLPVIKSDFVFEGGGLESNGKGTFLVIKQMALQRNPGKSLADIELELSRTIGARKIIWLEEGLIEDKILPDFGPFHKNYFGGGANMHIDELCRFVNNNTVVLPYITEHDRNRSPVDSINYVMLEKNYSLLKRSTTADGDTLVIYRIPMPEAEQLKYSQLVDSNNISEFESFGFAVGDTIYRIPAASYVNYFVSNQVVLIPKYWKPGMTDSQLSKDLEAKNLFTQLFPGRKIIQIFTLSINRGGGGIHCMTHEQPSITDQ